MVNIPKDLAVLSAFLGEFASIKWLTIGCSAVRISPINLETYYFGACSQTCFHEIHHYDPVEEVDSKQTLIQKKSSSIVDELLSSLFCVCAVSKIERLEYLNIHTSNYNCRYLLELCNLKMLKVCMEDLCSE